MHASHVARAATSAVTYHHASGTLPGFHTCAYTYNTCTCQAMAACHALPTRSRQGSLHPTPLAAAGRRATPWGLAAPPPRHSRVGCAGGSGRPRPPAPCPLPRVLGSWTAGRAWSGRRIPRCRRVRGASGTSEEGDMRECVLYGVGVWCCQRKSRRLPCSPPLPHHASRAQRQRLPLVQGHVLTTSGSA